MRNSPLYKGKLTVYLDHNILDFFVKNGLGIFGQRLINDYQVIYSDETLKEIRRSKGYENKFLSVLEELNAYYLKIVVELPSFRITDKVEVTSRNPDDVYAEYCKNFSDKHDIIDSIYETLFKLLGGRNNDSFADVMVENDEKFYDLTQSLRSLIHSLPHKFRKNKLSIVDELDYQYQLNSTKTMKELNDSPLSNEDWKGYSEFRNHINIHSTQLNNIEPPNVLIKIWNLYKILPPYNESELDIEDFYGIKKNLIFPNEPLFQHQKITSIYTTLNLIGFNPDSKLKKKRRFVASMSDNSHASMASFADMLLSNDESFIKKVNAIYEFLEVDTDVVFVSKDCFVHLKNSS